MQTHCRGSRRHASRRSSSCTCATRRLVPGNNRTILGRAWNGVVDTYWWTITLAIGV